MSTSIIKSILFGKYYKSILLPILILPFSFMPLQIQYESCLLSTYSIDLLFYGFAGTWGVIKLFIYLIINYKYFKKGIIFWTFTLLVVWSAKKNLALSRNE